MPNPKRRHSNQRTRKRRTHDKLTVNAVSACSNCHKVKRPHRVCPHCGYYDGRPVITIKPRKTKKKT